LTFSWTLSTSSGDCLLFWPQRWVCDVLWTLHTYDGGLTVKWWFDKLVSI
jgi:hypothetical protein